MNEFDFGSYLILLALEYIIFTYLVYNIAELSNELQIPSDFLSNIINCIIYKRESDNTIK